MRSVQRGCALCLRVTSVQDDASKRHHRFVRRRLSSSSETVGAVAATPPDSTARERAFSQSLVAIVSPPWTLALMCGPKVRGVGIAPASSTEISAITFAVKPRRARRISAGVCACRSAALNAPIARGGFFLPDATRHFRNLATIVMEFEQLEPISLCVTLGRSQWEAEKFSGQTRFTAWASLESCRLPVVLDVPVAPSARRQCAQH